MIIQAASGACSTSFEFPDLTGGGISDFVNIFKGVDIGVGGLPILKFKLRCVARCTNVDCPGGCSWAVKRMSKIVEIPLAAVAPGLDDACLQALANCDSGTYGGYASEAICINSTMDSPVCNNQSIEQAIDWAALGAEVARIALDFVSRIPKCLCPVNGVAVDLTDMDMFPLSKAITAAFEENIKRSASN